MYGIKKYGDTQYGAGDSIVFGSVPTAFSVRSAFEGPQIVMSWDPVAPNGISELRLLRKTGSFSVDDDDGKELIREFSPGPFSTTFVDRNVDDGTVYYYTLMVQDVITGFILFDSTTQKSALALDTSFFKKRMFALLPSLYRLADQGKI